MTPITKLLKNLSLLKSQLPLKQPIVLLMSGAFNPIHKQHIGTLEIAKKEIEAKDSTIKVVAGYLSPSSDLYVNKKLKDEAISAEHRIKMIKLAVQESDWIDVDEWEIGASIDRNRNIQTYELAQYLLNYLNSDPNVLKYSNNLKVMFVVGSDSCLKSKDKSRFKKLFEAGIELIVVNREQNDPNWESKCKDFLDSCLEENLQKESFFLFESNGDYEIRSTEIRSMLKNKAEGLESFLHSPVLEYIKKNELLQKEEQFETKVMNYNWTNKK